MNPFRALSRAAWLAIAAILAVVLLLGTCQALKASREAGKRAEAGKTLSDGRTAAGQDASAVRDRADERDDAITSAVKDATDEIRNAPDPGSRDRAALRGLCRIDPSASPDCGLLNADPGRMD